MPLLLLLIAGLVVFFIKGAIELWNEKKDSKASNGDSAFSAVDENKKDDSIKLFYSLKNSPDVIRVTRNFVDIIPEHLLTDYEQNTLFLTQYLSSKEWMKPYLTRLNCPKINLFSIVTVYNQEQVTTFNNLLCREFGVNNELVDMVSFLLINHVVVEKYSTIFEEKYDNSKGATESCDAYIYRCYDSNLVDKQDGYGYACLAYYVLKQKNDIYRAFPNEIINIQSIVRRVVEKQQKDILEKQILKPTTEDSSISIIEKPTIDDVDMMTGSEFEGFVCELYRKMGYTAYVTKASGDQGLDVIAEKNGKRIGIQAKCYSGSVGNSAVQEAVAGKNYYNCDRIVVVTNNYFTNSAISLANANNVVLWNRDILKTKIDELY